VEKFVIKVDTENADLNDPSGFTLFKKCLHEAASKQMFDKKMKAKFKRILGALSSPATIHLDAEALKRVFSA
jgi:hypothetical protein